MKIPPSPSASTPQQEAFLPQSSTLFSRFLTPLQLNFSDYILDVDCFSGCFEVLTLTSDRLRRLPTKKDYAKAHSEEAEQSVTAEYRRDFLEKFSVCDMLAAFAKGAGSVEMEYQVQKNGAFYWKKRLAFPYSVENGTMHILLYVRDITQLKNTELQRQEENANYILALQGMYEEIFQINLEDDTITPVRLDQEHLTATEKPIFNIHNFLEVRAGTMVDPAYTQVFNNTYSKENLWHYAGSNKVLEVEYRRRLVEGEEYHWISATLQPGLRKNTLLLFLRDVTRIKEAENNFYTALKNNYGDIFTISIADDKFRLIAGNTDMSVNVVMQGDSFSQNMAYVAENCVHPEDRESFLAFNHPDNLLQCLTGNAKVSHEHRMRSTGDYHWYETVVLPLPGAQRHEMLVLSQDITERKALENAKHQMEQRYNAVFRQSYDFMIEVQLATGLYEQRQFNSMRSQFPLTGFFPDLLEQLKSKLHPDDAASLLAERGLEHLRQSFAQKESLPTSQYRVIFDGIEHWMESRVFFLNDETGPTACSLVRDITEQKNREAERDAETQRLNLALRDTYTEIFELDTVHETAKILFHSSQLLVPITETPSTDPIPRLHIVNTFIHPDDRERMWGIIKGESLREAFAAGEGEVTVEFRRKSKEGGYLWLMGTALPVREALPLGSKALFFLKDISQRKEKEKQERVLEQYGLALRNIYDFFCEINLCRNSYRAVHIVEEKFVIPETHLTYSVFLNEAAVKLTHPEDIAALQQFFAAPNIRKDFASGCKHRMGEFRILHITGDFQWTSFTMFPTGSAEEDDRYLLFGLNIHSHKQAEEIARKNLQLEQQRIADERYRIVVQQSDTLIFEWKSQSDDRYISPLLQERFAGNYDGRDILTVWEEDSVLHPDDLPHFERFKQHHLRGEVTVRLLQRMGGFLWCKVAVSSLTNAQGEIYHSIGTVNDVDAATRTSHALLERAERDALTGVYNMRTFYTKAVEMMRQYPSRSFYVIRMDIDDFKIVNDLYGMEEGDQLLKKIARTLQSLMIGRSVCGRISGDVFCACVDFDQDAVLRLVQRMTEVMTNYPLPGSVQPSFGICKVENINTPITLLCDWANIALKTVKGNSVRFYAFYDGSLRDTFLKEKRIRGEMHTALEQGQFAVYLQPKIHMPDASVVGAEALVRWKHPAEGLIPPDEFIPLFEKNGFILHMDEYIWEQTCMLLRRWLDQGRRPLPLSINVSRLHILDVNLSSKLDTLIKKYQLSPQLLELELTESLFLDNQEQLLNTINSLRSMGFAISLDDFGAGFSSLNMLKSLPVKTLKIDKGFFDEILDTEKGQTIIRHVISLAKDMQMEVIAEGVESARQAEFLCKNGCTLAQGYLYSPPIPIEDFEIMVFGGPA